MDWQLRALEGSDTQVSEHDVKTPHTEHDFESARTCEDL